jgi:hypothetical protein
MSMIFMVDAVNLALDLDEIGRKPEKSQKYVGPGTQKITASLIPKKITSN